MTNAITTTGNKADNKTTATATTTTTKKGLVRVKGGGKAIVSRFVAATALPIDTTSKFETVKPLLKTGNQSYTCFGHNGQTLSIAKIVDNWLYQAIQSGTVDSSELLESAFTALTTTSRVQGAPIETQVNATFTKVIDHLGIFDTSKTGFTKYLLKRSANQSYSPDEITIIANTLWPVLDCLRHDFMSGRKNAKKYYKDKK